MYAEVQRHLIRGQEVANQRVQELARQWKLPVIASNGVRFTHPKKRALKARQSVRDHQDRPAFDHLRYGVHDCALILIVERCRRLIQNENTWILQEDPR